MAKKVYIPLPISQVGVDYLLERGYEIVMDTPTDPETLKANLADADGMIIKYTPITDDILSAAPKLKVIGKHGIGLNNVDILACTKHGVYLCNTPYAAINAVAEHVMMMVIALAKGIKQTDAAVRRGDYHKYRDNNYLVELADCTLTLIGIGRIGALVAQKAYYGFGMKVIAYDPYIDPSKVERFVELCNDLDSALGRADFVSMQVNLVDSTREMVDLDFLKKMKPTAYFINTARGLCTKEEDVVYALTHGIIAGAGIDAFTHEPVPKDDPLCSLDNVILSPHFATYSIGAQNRMALGAAEAVHEGLSGKKPTYSVNNPIVNGI